MCIGTDSQDQLPFTSETKDGEVQNLHPDARSAPAVEFEGSPHPQTGEVGGPKTDPRKWKSEWSFGGRTVDF